MENMLPPVLGEDGYILEGLLATLGEQGEPHLAPMGPIVRRSMEYLWLRPFRSSTTFANLERTRAGVFHVTDDVELIAQAAVGQLESMPGWNLDLTHLGPVLTDTCRWYAVSVESLDDAQERTSVVAKVVEHGSLRDFTGFNRAKHAVIEAAIIATRLHLTEASVVASEMERFGVVVKKTGASAERRAFAFLVDHVRRFGEVAS